MRIWKLSYALKYGKKATKGVGCSINSNAIRETNNIPSMSQLFPPDEQVEGVGMSNMEKEWSKVSSYKIYEDPPLQLEGNETVNVTRTEDEIEEQVSDALDNKILRLKAAERKAARTFKQNGIDKRV